MKKTWLPEVHLDRSPEAPSLRRQIETQLLSAIRSGALPCGARLPSSRLMARLLNVSRGTVADAYDALLATGALKSRAKSGVSVAPFAPSAPALDGIARAARAAHYPGRVCLFEDPDGTLAYLNVGH